MPKYTLTYFNARGRAEPIRMIFKLAGVEFEDIRLPFPLDDVWAEAKKDGSKYPFGQVPVLDVDGTVLSHSMSILKYLAREFGFAPRDNLQQAQADAIVDQIQDITNKYGWFYFAEQDPAKKEAQKKKWLEKTVPDTLAGLERILNSSGTGYFVTDKITYAEIAFFTTINNCAAGGKTEIPPQLADFPKTRALYEKIMNEPIIARYMKDRPAGDV